MRIKFSARCTTSVFTIALIASACGTSPTAEKKEPAPTDRAAGSLLLADFCKASADAQPNNTARQLLLTDVRGFAVDLSKQLLTGEENKVLSALSVQMAFGLLRGGATGVTKSEIDTTFKLGATGYDVDAAFKDLTASLRCLPQGADSIDLADVGVHIGNSLWTAAGHALADAYAKNLRVNYAAEARSLDFATDAAGAAKTINDWTNEATFGKIPEIVSSDMFDSETRLVLANAIHFKNGWKRTFDVANTKDEDFTVAGGQVKAVPTMHASDLPLYYKETSAYQAVQLPFEQGVMTIYLPKGATGLPDFVGALALDAGSTDEGWSKHRVTLSLPKFKIEADIPLLAPLKALGVNKVFGSGAELGGLFADNSEAVFVSDVFQKAVIDVNEKGAEAAAVTVIIGEANSAPVQEESPRSNFKADHPFFFTISSSNAVLFTGTVVAP